MCGQPRDREGQRYCSRCHAAYMRDWREARKLSDDEWALIRAYREAKEA